MDVREEPMQPFPPNSEIGSKNGAILGRMPRHESTSNGDDAPMVITSETRSGKSRRSKFFFRPGAKFSVKVYLDGDRSKESAEWATLKLDKEPVAEGTLTVGDTVFVDSEAMNEDPFKKVDKVKEWRHEFDQIGKDLD